jgi:Domain of Unknown Function (DUF1259)
MSAAMAWTYAGNRERQTHSAKGDPVKIRLQRLAILTSVALISVATVLVSSGSAAIGAPARQAGDVDWNAVSDAVGRSGSMMPGDVFRIGIPRTDLKVTVDGVPVQAGFALGSYAAFKQFDDGTMVMGDLVLLDEEVNAVMQGLFDQGFEVSALHNHLLNMTPHVMYMHYEGHGDALQLAQSLHQALSASATPLSPAVPPPPAAAPSGPQLDVGTLDSALGYSGKVNGSIVQYTIARAETITESGHELLPAMGVATALNFQPTGAETAAITGDFALIGSEVNPVQQALKANGIDVTAVHQHHLNEQPKLYYMHFWGNTDPAKLAQGLRAALDQTNSATAEVPVVAIGR